jgi:hypothetical protein
MKKSALLVIALFLVSFSGNAQWYVLKFKKTKSQLNGPIKFQKDQDGKIIFYEVVQVDTVPRDTLWKNAKLWMRSIINEKGDKIVDEQYLYGTIEANVSFMVYTSSMISKIPHGRFFYDVSIDIKDKKYRYTFTNFRFQYYKQERKDMKYYPIHNKFKGLEVEKFGGYQTAWDDHRWEVKRRVNSQIANLKRVIVLSNKVIALDTTSMKPVIKTKDW